MSEPFALLPQPRAVIFDLDGTLVDTVETRIQAWLMVFAEERIVADRAVIAGMIGSDGRRLAREIAGAAGVNLADGRDEAIDERCGRIYAALNSDPRPFPGAQALLARRDATGLPWAIATSSRRDQVAASVDALQLTRPATVVDGTHVAHAKPAPDLLLLAAGQLGVVPSACWYVGDATWDMLAAVAAGMTAVGVATGAVGADALRAAGAAVVVASLAAVEI